MSVFQIVEETKKRLNKNPVLSPEVIIRDLLDRNYDDIEHDIFGSNAIDCLPINPESTTAIPQGNPFLKYAIPFKQALKKYKGIYSLD